ncbi:cysteine peptidase family C39 domain-containing protein [Singulisphaera acidiphila]|uniref:ABC-type bacteriocin/lantibiotic exporter with N-terminal double-glycine peptidase domain n=1 Tax=Singulisphaera acidiphila (strain ATCC BAA-1392 / DSM 18658 / VKM B-2454 / MOB10) TaxID=886293 RepID=L0DM54_SINAD|nr:cysteine peptidase family C39 domain-containing protein [Singulisphaera acidiphila]AGA29771.1 ABC-type bacteriocin/lantibiotic exporter with N-terminal double-glycine peptidase domain [Singulisphaera acidiphila DSM 18658]
MKLQPHDKAPLIVRALVITTLALGNLLFLTGQTSAADTVIETPEHYRKESKWQVGPYCGPSSLYVFFQLLDKGVSLDRIAELCKVTDEGCSLEDLRRAALALGVKTQMVRGTSEELAKLTMPLIIHSSVGLDDSEGSGHFFVLCGKDNAYGGKYLLIDPSSGQMVYRDTIDGRNWSGYALMATPPWYVATAKNCLYLLLTALAVTACFIAFRRQNEPSVALSQNAAITPAPGV